MRVKRTTVVFLMETKGSKSLLESVKRKIRFTNCFVVESIGKSGGLALMWNEDTLLNIVNYSQFHIHSKNN